MHETILLIDGSRETLEIAQRVLHNERYDVRVASNAEEALKLIDRLRPRLVLTDMRLPGAIDPMEMVRRLRTEPATRAAAVVMVTTDASAAEREAAMAAGCDDFISQPLTTAMLRELAAKWIAREPGAGRFSPTGSTWTHRLFEPARRACPVGQAPTYKCGTTFPPADHFGPQPRCHGGQT
jgi:CheY-like chemotaxis protein